jgi:TonB-linked SusC/RagA family outer membrane protein
MPVKGVVKKNLFIPCFWLLLPAMLVGAGSSAQSVTLSVKKAPLEQVLLEIKKQTGYGLVYVSEEMRKAGPVTLSLDHVPVAEALRLLFKGQPLDYVTDGRTIIISARPPPEASATVDLAGQVVNEQNEAIPGASITVKNKRRSTATDALGRFVLRDVDRNAYVEISSVGYRREEVRAVGGRMLLVRMETEVGSLDEKVVIAYGATTRKLNTGSVTRVDGEAIAGQPVAHFLAALQGRVPGMTLRQTSGVAGSVFDVEIRGRSSIDPDLSQNEPLFVIDGLPFEAGSLPVNHLPSAANNPRSITQGGLSLLTTIDPSDIESVEVLKDADATAIYGSRGANGVILITSKQGHAGKPRVKLDIYSGISRTGRTMKMLDTKQYVSMRKEAFANDTLVMTNANAPDILLWDTTRFTDFRKLLSGGTASVYHGQASVSGGNGRINYYLNAAYRKESAVFPGDFVMERKSLRMAVSHQGRNGKFGASLQGNYVSGSHRLPAMDPSYFLNLPPHLLVYDSAGRFNWQEKGVGFQSLAFINPMAALLRKYDLDYGRTSVHLQSSYEFLPGLKAKVNAGFNWLDAGESSTLPIASFASSASQRGTATFAQQEFRNWIVEPQLEWKQNVRQHSLNLLMGATWQQRDHKLLSERGTGYTNDDLLGSLAGAATVTVQQDEELRYRYTALFGRLRYDIRSRYLFNVTARYDGSSRFGKDKRFAPFGAVGAAWVFSAEDYVRKRLPFLSFGKLRASYGFTGNDQVGDYRFVDTWTGTQQNYQGVPGLRPLLSANTAYNWELTRKMEVALETGFINNRIVFSAAFYRHRSSNQLVEFELPAQAGFTTVYRNIDALVQNQGVELQLQTRNVVGKRWEWSSNFHITLPQNRLLYFPQGNTAAYERIYAEGQSLSLIRRVRLTGVDPQTGVYRYEDMNGDGRTTGADEQILGNLDPCFYGGLGNNISFSHFQFEFFWEFMSRRVPNYLASHYFFPPGSLNNQPAIVLGRWQKPGDPTLVQRFTTRGSTAAGQAAALLTASDGVYGDGSFARLRNISLSYELPVKTGKHTEAVKCTIYLRGQNLATITRYESPDPETQNLYQLPPLKTMVAGVKIQF